MKAHTELQDILTTKESEMIDHNTKKCINNGGEKLEINIVSLE